MSVHDGARLGPSLFGEELDPHAYLLKFFPTAPVPPLDQVVRTAEPLVAVVNQGTWIARCPCGARGIPSPGAVVFLDWPFVWCIRCQNGSTGRGWRPVIIPSPEERQAIEAVLNCRPDPRHRNWESGESVADLVAQNHEHGDPVPDLGLLPAPAPEPSWLARVTPFSPLIRESRGRLKRLLRRR